MLIFPLCFLSLVYVFVSLKDSPLEPGLKTLPFWYAIVFMINSFSIFYNGPECEYWGLIENILIVKAPFISLKLDISGFLVSSHM